MQVASFTFNDFAENTYVLYDETGECAIVDPGCFHSHEREELSAFIAEHRLKPVLLLNTHCHIDHILGNAYVARQYDLPLHLHKDELKTYSETGRWSAMFGIVVDEIPAAQVYITEGSELTFGNTRLEVFLTPGHSIASLSFYNRASAQLVSGDVLFYQSIGRTDLPDGNFDTLVNSIRTKLFVLPDDTRVYSGHGPQTTIGYEKKHNPFLV